MLLNFHIFNKVPVNIDGKILETDDVFINMYKCWFILPLNEK